MAKLTDARVVEAQCEFEPVTFRTPLKFGGRVIDKAMLINVTVTLENSKGKSAAGTGSMPLGNIWAWPGGKVEPESTHAAMKTFAEEVVALADAFPEFGHPIDLVYHLSGEYHHLAKRISDRMKLAEPMPELAQLVAASPLDAAIHDAYGRLLDLNSFDTLTEEFMHYDLAEYLDDSFEGEYLDQYTLREPQAKMPLYHLVGALDPLTKGDLKQPIGDGLPETLGDWIAAEHLTHLKIKLAGDDLTWDVERVLAVDRVATETQAALKQSQWVYSLDFNEKCANVQYILDFLKQIQKKNSQAYDRVQYIEQPTHRDLKAHPENRMHEAAKLKPVVIDESLVDYEALLLSREQGYTGVALKACKGQTESLLMAAAAQKFGMFLCVQDLSCPGYSFLHSASLAAHIPGVTAIEGNGRQFCPGPNKKWAKLYPSMFHITDGTVGTGTLNGPGLGF
ncbi:MAG: enolase C-terminal domain-like protein [Planctomycetaceae bacterium]